MKYELILSDKSVITCDTYSETNRGVYYSVGTMQVFIADIEIKSVNEL